MLRLEPYNSFELNYPSDCKSSKCCGPFGNDKFGYFLEIMSLKVIHCSCEKESPKHSLIRFLIQFPNNTFINAIPPSNYHTTLAGEGSWDTKNNRLCIAACRLLNPTGYYNLANTHVRDCSFRLSLAFPAIWTIRSTSTIAFGLPKISLLQVTSLESLFGVLISIIFYQV